MYYHSTLLNRIKHFQFYESHRRTGSGYFVRIVILFGIALFAGSLFAQVEVQEEMRSMSQGLQPAYIILIPEAEERTIQQNWVRTMRREYKGRVRTSRGEVAATRVVFVALGLGDIEIYARITARSNDVELVAWFKSDAAFVSSESDLTASNEIKRLLSRFAQEQFIERRKEALKEQEDKYEDQQRSLTRLQREKQRLEGNIEKWEQQIAEARQRIYQNEKEQEQLNQQIKDQLEQIERRRLMLEEARSQK